MLTCVRYEKLLFCFGLYAFVTCNIPESFLADIIRLELFYAAVQTFMSFIKMQESSSSMTYPSCWSDDSRMTALFAPFREYSLNPHDWDSKFAFWSEMIEKWCKSKNSCSFTLEDLHKAFLRNGRVPVCLPTVVHELHRRGTLLTTEEFSRTISSSETWLGWVLDYTVKKPVSWTFRKVKDAVLSPDTSAQTQFLHMDAIKVMSESVLSAATGDLRGELVDMNTLLCHCGILNISAKEAYLLACWLQYQGHAAILDPNIQENPEPYFLLKLREPGKKGRVVISDADRAVHSLKSNQKALTHHIEKLEKEMQGVLSEAKSYLSKGMRSLAKSSLRKKKEIEKIIEKRARALENVHSLLARIQESKSDSQVLEAYQLGAAALKNAFKDAGLSEDMVSRTVDDVHDAFDIHNEIVSALSEPIDKSVDDNLEDELAALLLDENTTHSGAGGNLPDSPSDLRSSLQNLNLNKGPREDWISGLPDAPSGFPSPDGPNMTPF